MEKYHIEEIKKIVGEEQVICQEAMAGHTTFRIGGPAACFVTPGTIQHLGQCIRYVQQQQIPWYVIGNGSNLLVQDEGIDGVVLCLSQNCQGDLHKILALEETEAQICQQVWEQYQITPQEHTYYMCVGAGVKLATLAGKACAMGYEGFAFAGGIPGTVGGAVVMNAGAYGGEMGDVIVGAKILDKEGNCYVATKEQLQLSYRHSLLQENGHIVVEVLFAFSKGDASQIQQEMKTYNKQRREKQPLEYASAGSTFKRPAGYFAGKLIQDAGLKGYRIGDVMVSDKHSGFVVNVGQGTATEAKQVIAHVQQTVREQFGVDLDTEVKYLP